MEKSNLKKAHGMPEHQRLLCRWTMELAALLVREHNLTKSRALELAHLNRKLLMRLGSGKVRFVYQKEDGTEREALGTLCRGIAPAFDAYESKGKKKEEQWRKIIISACEQCGRATVPKLNPTEDLEKFLSEKNEGDVLLVLSEKKNL